MLQAKSRSTHLENECSLLRHFFLLLYQRRPMGATTSSSSTIPIRLMPLKLCRNSMHAGEFISVDAVSVASTTGGFFTTELVSTGQTAVTHSNITCYSHSRGIIHSIPNGVWLEWQGVHSTTKIYSPFFFNSGLWGYWHCGHSWPIVPASDDSEDDCGEADGM
jgi:hypothetical protein